MGGDPQVGASGELPAGIPGRDDATDDADRRRLEALLTEGASTGPASTPTYSSTRRRTCRRCSGGCWPRRGRGASWTVVGDAAQSSWPDPAEAGQAPAGRSPAGAPLRSAVTNYRNAREIFDYAGGVILPVVPDADLPDAVRETGVDRSTGGREAVARVNGGGLDQLLGEVEGTIAVIAARRWRDGMASSRRRRRRTGPRGRPDVAQGAGVGRDGRRRPRRRSSRSHPAACGSSTCADPRGSPHARPAPDLNRRRGLPPASPEVPSARSFAPPTPPGSRIREAQSELRRRCAAAEFTD